MCQLDHYGFKLQRTKEIQVQNQDSERTVGSRLGQATTSPVQALELRRNWTFSGQCTSLCKASKGTAATDQGSLGCFGRRRTRMLHGLAEHFGLAGLPRKSISCCTVETHTITKIL